MAMVAPPFVPEGICSGSLECSVEDATIRSSRAPQQEVSSLNMVGVGDSLCEHPCAEGFVPGSTGDVSSSSRVPMSGREVARQ
jgi:hypothetical protein